MTEKEFVGRKVSKFFPGYGATPFTGKVSSLVKVKNNVYYRVKYEDGDVEDITKQELLQILQPEARKRRAPSPAPAAKETQKAKDRRVTAEMELSPAEEEPPAAVERSASPTPPSHVPEAAPAPAAEKRAKEREVEEVVPPAAAEERPEVVEEEEEEPAATQPGAKEATPEGLAPESMAAEVKATPEIEVAPETVAAVPSPPPGAIPVAPARLRRYTHPSTPKGALSGIPSSESVAAGGLLFISDICRPTRAAADTADEVRYRRQGKMVLESLGQALKRAGAGPRDLVSLNVRLKDNDTGREAFGEALAVWLHLNGAPAPAVSIGESYMNGDNTLIGVSAVAVAPAAGGVWEEAGAVLGI